MLQQADLVGWLETAQEDAKTPERGDRRVVVQTLGQILLPLERPVSAAIASSLWDPRP